MAVWFLSTPIQYCTICASRSVAEWFFFLNLFHKPGLRWCGVAIRWGRFSLEVAFVISMLIILKGWVFPFFISIWFPTNELSAWMYDWTVIIVGIITCFIYCGFGSSARYHYQFSLLEGILLFLCLHLFLLFGMFGEFSRQWSHLLGDLLALFVPASHVEGWQFLLIYLLFFLVGKRVQIDEKETEERLYLFVKGK
jgi:hypothetical protein